MQKYSFCDGASLLDSTLYHIIIGRFVYLIIGSPDIAYTVHVSFVVSSTTIHWAAVLCTL